jgi:hypothetical protein
MYTRLQIAVWSAAAIFGLAQCNEAAAPAAHPAYAQVLSELHQAKHLLDHANHTYNGHRAKADHEISKAIHILHHEHHKHNPKAATVVHHHKPIHESQFASDTQLRQAEKLVHAALHELHQHHHNHKIHEASKLLHAAAHEIQLALHVHHKHHVKN